MTALESLATRLYGWTREEAHEAGVCIRCRQPIDYDEMEPVDRREYALSGLDGVCFDAVMAEAFDD